MLWQRSSARDAQEEERVDGVMKQLPWPPCLWALVSDRESEKAPDAFQANFGWGKSCLEVKDI